jgi:hypothetical protein
MTLDVDYSAETELSFIEFGTLQRRISLHIQNQVKDETGKPKSVEDKYSWEDGIHTLHGAGPIKQQNEAESACKTRRMSRKRARE